MLKKRFMMTQSQIYIKHFEDYENTIQYSFVCPTSLS